MPVTLCLLMIVKDESHIILETLENVSKYIDYWVICDTGSTDGTQRMIKEFFDTKGILGELHQHDWKTPNDLTEDFGFSYARTNAFKAAKGKCDYLWIIDADDLVKGTLPKEKLGGHDRYDLKYGTEKSDDFGYWRGQIFRSSFDWEYVCVVHEVAMATETVKSTRLMGDYYIASRRLGARTLSGETSKKYLRDAEWIEFALKREQREWVRIRYHFYLGRSWDDHAVFCSGKEREEALKNAIKWYETRVEDLPAVKNEETFYALYRIGICKIALDAPKKEIEEACLKAYLYMPERIESIVDYCKYLIGKNDYNDSKRYSKVVCGKRFPEEHSLFVTRSAYTFSCWDNLAVSYYYTGNLKKGLKVYLKLIKSGTVMEPSCKERVNENVVRMLVKSELLY